MLFIPEVHLVLLWDSNTPPGSVRSTFPHPPQLPQAAQPAPSLRMIPFGEGKLFSDPFPTGVAGKESEAWTAESIFSQSRVGELGADFRVTSCCLSLTASSCRRSEGGEKEKKTTKNPILVIDSLTNALSVHLGGAAGDNSQQSWV